MKAVVVMIKNGKWISESYESIEELTKNYKVVGYTEDLTPLRASGALVHRAELDNQPKLENLCGPMWDGGMLRYESWDVYDLLSR